MEVFIARQHIFDRNMNVFGYELLYRRSMNNFYEGIDDNKATAELINNAFFAMQLNELTGGTKAFINFSEEMILKKIPLLLPKESIVIEILERIEVSEALVNACKDLRKEGYLIALDDFIYQEAYIPLIDTTHIIKIEFSIESYKKQQELIKRYKNRIKFLAEKVETREEYNMALDMGYDYFQGYFFSKPVVVKGNEISSLNANIVRLIEQLNQDEPHYQKIAEIIETDIGLSYKLLKIVNSIYFGSRSKIHSLKNALVRLGIDELKKWVYLIMLKDIQRVENKELIKICLIRARLMELIALQTGMKDKHLQYFMTGLFSAIDILLNRNMKDIVDELPLAIEVRDALLGKNNELRNSLELVCTFDRLSGNIKEYKDLSIRLSQSKLMNSYFEALRWANSLDY